MSWRDNSLGLEIPEGGLASDLELRIAIKTAADTAETRGYDQIRALLTIAFTTLDNVIAMKERDLAQASQAHTRPASNRVTFLRSTRGEKER